MKDLPHLVGYSISLKESRLNIDIDSLKKRVIINKYTLK